MLDIESMSLTKIDKIGKTVKRNVDGLRLQQGSHIRLRTSKPPRNARRIT